MDNHPDPRTLHRLAFGIAALAILARLWMAWATRSTGEDFLITLRYAENIAHGQGFVFNPGERVLGTTTPLYTLLLALFAFLHLNADLCGKLGNILADGVTCYLLARLLARPEIQRPIAGLFAALLYALSSTPLSISIGGMETGLVTCVGMGMITAYIARQTRPIYLLGAILFLLRVDGLLLFLLLAAASALRDRRLPWQDCILFLLLLLPWLTFAFLYFGSPVPTSLIAKLLVYAKSLVVPRSLILDAFATQFISGAFQKLLTLLFLVGAFLTPRLHKGLGVPLLWLLLYYGVMLTSRVPAFAWYFLPPWPLFLGIAALGGNALLTGIGGKLTQTSHIATLWLPVLALVGLYGLVHLRSVRADIANNQWQETNLRVPMGLWFRDHAKPNERILLEPIGYVGYYSQRPILDMIGLVSPEVFPSYHKPDFLADIVTRLRPEWLCLRPGERDRLQRQNPALPDAEYTYVHAFQLPSRPVDFLVYHRKQDSAPNIAQ